MIDKMNLMNQKTPTDLLDIRQILRQYCFDAKVPLAHLVELRQREDESSSMILSSESFVRFLTNECHFPLTEDQVIVLSQKFGCPDGRVALTPFIKFIGVLPPRDYVDPERVLVRLPQPYRRITKVLEQDILDVAWTRIQENHRAAERSSSSSGLNPILAHPESMSQNCTPYAQWKGPHDVALKDIQMSICGQRALVWCEQQQPEEEEEASVTTWRWMDTTTGTVLMEHHIRESVLCLSNVTGSMNDPSLVDPFRFAYVTTDTSLVVIEIETMEDQQRGTFRQLTQTSDLAQVTTSVQLSPDGQWVLIQSGDSAELLGVDKSPALIIRSLAEEKPETTSTVVYHEDSPLLCCSKTSVVQATFFYERASNRVTTTHMLLWRKHSNVLYRYMWKNHKPLSSSKSEWILPGALSALGSSRLTSPSVVLGFETGAIVQLDPTSGLLTRLESHHDASNDGITDVQVYGRDCIMSLDTASRVHLYYRHKRLRVNIDSCLAIRACAEVPCGLVWSRDEGVMSFDLRSGQPLARVSVEKTCFQAWRHWTMEMNVMAMLVGESPGRVVRFYRISDILLTSEIAAGGGQQQWTLASEELETQHRIKQIYLADLMAPTDAAGSGKASPAMVARTILPTFSAELLSLDEMPKVPLRFGTSTSAVSARTEHVWARWQELQFGKEVWRQDQMNLLAQALERQQALYH